MTRTMALLVAQVLALALSGGCSAPSGSDEPTSPTDVHPTDVTPEHNDTDLAYVDQLGAQHQQAVDMVMMVADRDVSAELREVAAEIGRARSDEMRALRTMGRVWGVPPHPADYHGNPGELTMEQLSALYILDGAAFERRWTQRMVDNHLGASAMSMAEVDDGLNVGTREFARALVRMLESQIDRLQALPQ